MLCHNELLHLQELFQVDTVTLKQHSTNSFPIALFISNTGGAYIN